ncbi:MAG TPA: substrate-binding domain-containing protein [Acidobacteriaceae bacterium]|nr:substrate-binding domain-containing protein [Acidobacteriaceae bacterium]
MRKIQAAILVILPLALSVLTGCQRHSYSETYYLVSNNVGLQYWQTAISGFNAAARHIEVKGVVVGPQNFDSQAELQALTSAVAAKPEGILISVTDAPLMQDEINKAIDAGIPVITFDSDAPHSHRMYFIGTNNLEAGHLGGQRVVEKLNGKGNVVFFTITGQPNLDERLNGYEEILSKYPGIKTAEIVNIMGNSNVAFDATQRLVLLKGADKIDAFICLEASSCKAVGEVLNNDNIKDRLVVAMDVDQETLDFIKQGVIDSTISQKPYTMAYFGLMMLGLMHEYPPKPILTDYSVNTFSPYPVFVDTGTSLVDKDNVDLYLAQEKEAKAK